MSSWPSPISAVPAKPSASLCGICLHYMLLLRLGALAGQLLGYGAVAILGLSLPFWTLSLLWVGLAAYTLVVLRRQDRTQATTEGTVMREAAIDLVSLTFAVYLTGGASNPLIILLLLPVTAAAATLGTRLIWLVTGIAVACYTALMFFHLDFPVPRHGLSGFGLHIQGMWYGFILSAILIAYFVAQMGAALRASDQALAKAREEALVENSPMGIFLAQNGRLTFVNPQLAELLEYPREELTGSEALCLVHPEDRDRVHAATLEGPTGQVKPRGIECRLCTRSGQQRWVAVRITQITYQGKVMMLGNLQDMTEHKRMETALRDLSARILNIQEEERRRVARDLHDGICQTLTATRFILEGYLGEPATPERRSSMARLRSLVPTLKEAVDEVRRISTDLRPAMLDELGLLATIRWFLGDLQRLHPELEVRSHLQAAESDIPERLKTNLFRLLQEATTNAIKHSHGTLLDVRLTAEQGVLRLTVEDDGEGFVAGKVTPEAGPGKHHGLGLSSMRERTELSGGTFRVSSMPGTGTSVEARWRLDAGAFSD